MSESEPTERMEQEEAQRTLMLVWKVFLGMDVAFLLLTGVETIAFFNAAAAPYTTPGIYWILVMVKAGALVVLIRFGRSYGFLYGTSWRPSIQRARYMRLLTVVAVVCALLLLVPGSPWSLLALSLSATATVFDMSEHY